MATKYYLRNATRKQPVGDLGPPPGPNRQPRKHRCSCGRYLGESQADGGYIVVKCPSCGAWRKLEFDVIN